VTSKKRLDFGPDPGHDTDPGIFKWTKPSCI